MLKGWTNRTVPPLHSLIASWGGRLVFAAGLLSIGGATAAALWDHSLPSGDGALAAQAARLGLDRQITGVLTRLERQRADLDTHVREEIRAHSAEGLALVQALNQQLGAVVPAEVLRPLMVDSLRSLGSFHGLGGYFVINEHGHALLAPQGRPGMGAANADSEAQGGTLIPSPVTALAVPGAEGFVRYEDEAPPGASGRTILAHFRPFPALGWTVGAAADLTALEAQGQEVLLKDLRAERGTDDPGVLLLPAEGARETPALGADATALAALPGGSALVASIQALARTGGGVARVDWPFPPGSPPAPGLVRVKVFEPWHWAVAVGEREPAPQAAAGVLAAWTDSGPVLLLLGGLLGGGALGVGLLVFGMGRAVRQARASLAAQALALEEREQERRLVGQVIETAAEAVLITDSELHIQRTNAAFSHLTGYPADEVLTRSLFLLASDRHDRRFLVTIRSAVRATGLWQGDFWVRRRDGAVVLCRLRLAQARTQEGKIGNHVALLSDISERKAAEERIRQLAYFDPLTQLPNRLQLRNRLAQAMAATERSGSQGAVLFIDLDNFKTLNDTRGHDIGDKLLIEVAARLRDALRERDVVARVGGDEFVVILPHLDADPAEAAAQVERVAEKILIRLNVPCEIEGLAHVTTPSIGACLFSGESESVDTLLKHADTAMYQAKARGRNRLCFFEPAIQDALMRRSRLENDLREAIDREEFVPFFQPQVDDEGTLVGAEVLVRWIHPKAGLIGPGEFVPLAEETGLIGAMGRQMLECTCALIKKWEAEGIGGSLALAVNVSAAQFRDPLFVKQVLDLLSHYGVDPGRLKLELTESLVIDDIQGSIRTMNRLKAEGLGFSMDDFGTGYSSLSQLKRLPLDQLKIDRSFVEDVTSDPNDAVIVRTIIAMSRSLGLDVLAEGVETPEQRAFLVANGCQAFQGFLFSPPVDARTFEDMLGGPVTFPVSDLQAWRPGGRKDYPLSSS
ncbi:EAL domain-containing protein [Pararhodospirillum oryzae]|uniref:GGDEF domain-containing protein n=1 Tax=Pararhodospirillum oryzae TaxID=478448 RepID=A0A512H8C7_9PROT|nr:EAL domain-containing protein [Pararhodospirillum oryzae]GEO81697.1 hypothetical protein ROR02_18280 [Pararhodospirillum oryzae]